ncbi:MAG: phosphoenolpyruvate--protein phosphotransferase [Verrucomicrobia bacterium]|nr:phosphoenolpyruvate--protein phosphotransferase [Verrucomicrobiota bacterium]
MKAPEDHDQEIYLKGAPVSEGIAIGIPIFLSYSDDDIPDFPISTGEVEGEIARYREALSSSREDLKKLQADLSGEGSKEVASIIGTHIEMLDDPLMTTHMETKIREMLKNTESVFHSVINDYEKRFSETNDSFFNERLSDFRDLSQRVLRNLCDSESISLDNIPPNSIVFAKELIPSDTASLQATRISAFVTQSGGGTSHAALIARAKGIPYVASIDMEVLQNAKGKCVIVDGLTGDIIVNPSHDTLEKYERLKNRLTTQYLQLEKDKHLLSETIDGYPLLLYANVNTVNDIDLVHHHGAQGIGLFRSEYLFMQDPALFFDEERQYFIYQQMFKRSRGLPLTFRALDLGGDKCSDVFEEMAKEPNPVLGCRGIRFLLRRVDVFKTQMRALLRAGASSELRILFPLISDIHEFREVKRILEEVKTELQAANIPHNGQPALGCMLEVPSAVLICDALAQEGDFLALGTNDLIQYTLGIDRSNPGMSDFYYPTHPGIIRMIKMTILEAKRFQKPVTICGEIASNPLFTPLLIGLGVQNFSCAPRFIPIIKRTVRHLSLLDCCDIAEHVLTMKTSAEIATYLAQCLQGSEGQASFKENL